MQLRRRASAYEALNSYQRSLVTEYAVLVNAENSYYALALANGIFTEELPLDMILSHISENPSSLIQINPYRCAKAAYAVACCGKE